MFIDHLALSYKCHSSIGNSLDLKKMLDEVVYTFVTQTDAVSGAFYLKDDEGHLYKYIQFDEKFDENVEEYHKESESFSLIPSKINAYHSILAMPVHTGRFYLIYKTNELDFDFIGSMFQDLIVKLNISIDACLNVQRLKLKNKKLDTLTNELKKQKIELENANKYQTNFLANVSHELKTPLNSIIVISSIMSKNKDESLNKKNLKNIKIINSCGNDLLFLINDILDISKIESGELSLNLKKIVLFELIEDIFNQMLPLVKDKCLRLEKVFHIDSNIVLFTDEGRVKQIIKNLLSNAIKFTEKGSITIDVSQVEDKLSIKVIDQGIGIEKSKLKTIFERFKQADGSTTRKYGGTGLGLSVSRELAELLDGSLDAQSQLGEGSTFELILPLKTNITNISDEKVSIGTIQNEEDFSGIILFDEDDDLSTDENENKPKISDKKVLIINKDHLLLFSYVIQLQKYHVHIDKLDDLDKIDEYNDNYDLIIINDASVSNDISEITALYEKSNSKILIISNEDYDTNNVINFDELKYKFLNTTLEILGIENNE